MAGLLESPCSGWVFFLFFPPSKAFFLGGIPGGAAEPVKEPFSTFVAAIPGDDWAQLVAGRKMRLSQREISLASIILRAPETCWGLEVALDVKWVLSISNREIRAPGTTGDKQPQLRQICQSKQNWAETDALTILGDWLEGTEESIFVLFTLPNPGDKLGG